MLAFAAPGAGQVITDAAVEKALAERAAAQDAAKAAEQAALDARAQQYLRMMQPLMWRELEFIRQTCDLTNEQRPKIKAAAEKGVLQAAKDIINPRGGIRSNSVTFASQTIKNDIAKALAETLSPEQSAKYQLEVGPRTTAYRRASIWTAVALIDDVLLLTETQRGEISKALETNWQDDWENWLIMGRYAGRYCPTVPDHLLTPHLNEEQKEVWRGLTKTTVNSWGSQAARNAEDDKWWEGK